MKAVRIHEFGDADQIRVDELPRPAAGTGEVLVAIGRVGVNPVDWKIRQGLLGQRSLPMPMTLGQDFAGEVVAGARAAGGFQAGDRVYGFANGAYAEYAAVATGDMARLPDNVSLETAAALPTPGLTAYQLVTEATGLQSGQTVLIHAGAGGVGTLVVQLARHLGVRVLATDLGRELDYLKQLGVERAWDANGPPFEQEVGKVDAVIALVGGELLRRSYGAVRRGGVIASTVGQLDQAEAERLGVRAVAFVMRRSSEDLARVAELASQEVLRPRIASVLPLDDARRAQEMSQRGEAQGKILLRAA